MTLSTPNLDDAGTFSILPCQTKKERQLFENIPELLHSKNQHFTPPFPGSVVKLIDPRGHFASEHGKIFPFIAYAHDAAGNPTKPIGRIAAILNRSHNNYYHDTIGFFGFFDVLDQKIVGQSLLKTATEILQKEGCTLLRGPYNPTINDDCGLLTEGCETRSFVSMPWNPAYYKKLYEAIGLESVRTLYAWMVPLDKPPAPRVTKIVERLSKRANVTLRTINLKKIEDEMKVIHRLYNATLDRNWGFYPISLDDLLSAAEDLKAIANPELIIFACKGGKEVGFSLSLPNIHEIFFAARKRHGLLRFLEIALRLQFQKIDTVRLCILGVDPEYQHQGLSALLFYEAFVRSQKYYRASEVSWVEANNQEILEGAALMGGYQARTYEIFEKKLP